MNTAQIVVLSIYGAVFMLQLWIYLFSKGGVRNPYFENHIESIGCLVVVTVSGSCMLFMAGGNL